MSLLKSLLLSIFLVLTMALVFQSSIPNPVSTTPDGLSSLRHIAFAFTVASYVLTAILYLGVIFCTVLPPNAQAAVRWLVAIAVDEYDVTIFPYCLP